MPDKVGMPKDRSKASLLSEQLDFESINGESGAPENGALEFEVEPPASAAKSASSAAQRPAAASKRPAPKKPALERKPVKVAKASEPDHFGRYAALIILCGFAILLAIFFYFRTPTGNAAGLSYIELPQQVAYVEGQVVRMKVTIQVRDEDREWLFENKKTLATYYQIELAKVNPDDLHSEAGFELVRVQLKDGLNKALKTDKIESVLINELLMQNRDPD
ncbi:flagellar basal body-associated FliL family protein [Undibacterium sp. Ji50W]|uniref:flagellar basal body-associated FliL family protein n=1 Tax=Undibacterium sp. Ji50W TaxID=3413041 RepID=UPI003BF2A24B